jgi:hypothetical protein
LIVDQSGGLAAAAGPPFLLCCIVAEWIESFCLMAMMLIRLPDAVDMTIMPRPDLMCPGPSSFGKPNHA